MTTLQDAFTAIEHFLAHCQQHLTRNELKMVRRRLVGTPFERGLSAQEQWTARQMVAYYWPRMSEAEQVAFLRQQRLARRRRQEEAPWS